MNTSIYEYLLNIKVGQIKLCNLKDGHSSYKFLHVWCARGQSISKGLFDVIVLTKNQRNLFKDFCPSL